jgi:hypothetical protein
MTIFLMDPTTLNTIFEFDCELDEGRDLEVQWTDKPVEAGYDVTLGGHVKDETFDLNGLVTSWPFNAPEDPGRVIRIDDSLRQLALKKQPVTVVTWWWAEKALITKVGGKSGKADGDALLLNIGLKTYREVKPQYTAVPPSRLKPKVRKRGKKAAKKPTTGKGPTKNQKKSWLAGIVDYGKGFFK